MRFFYLPSGQEYGRQPMRWILTNWLLKTAREPDKSKNGSRRTCADRPSKKIRVFHPLCSTSNHPFAPNCYANCLSPASTLIYRKVRFRLAVVSLCQNWSYCTLAVSPSFGLPFSLPCIYIINKGEQFVNTFLKNFFTRFLLPTAPGPPAGH